MKKILIIFLLLILLSTCNMEMATSKMIRVNSDHVVLAWQPPHVNFNQGPLSIDYYNVYYRIHGSPTWILIGEAVSGENPEYLIFHKDMGNGMYDFAVSAVKRNGEESNYHNSLDNNANPFTGWYVNWVYNE